MTKTTIPYILFVAFFLPGAMFSVGVFLQVIGNGYMEILNQPYGILKYIAVSIFVGILIEHMVILWKDDKESS